jgi:hypothetical protein
LEKVAIIHFVTSVKDEWCLSFFAFLKNNFSATLDPKFGCSYERYVSYFKLLSLQCQLQHTHTILPHSHVGSRKWPTPLPKITSPHIATWVLESQVFCNHVSTLLETKKKRAASSDYLFQQHPRIQQESFRSRKVRERCIAFLKSQICNRPMFERSPSVGAREWTCSDPCRRGYHIAHCTLHLEIWKTWSTDCFALQQKPKMELFCNSYL